MTAPVAVKESRTIQAFATTPQQHKNLRIVNLIIGTLVSLDTYQNYIHLSLDCENLN